MLSIREAMLEDVESLHMLYSKYLTQNPPEEPQDMKQWSELLESFIADPDYHLLVGECDRRIVSSVTLVVIRNLTHNLSPYSIIENVVTHSDFRDRGYAAALIAEAKEIAKESGCYKIMLMTGSKEESTLRFYESCGFSKHDKTAFLVKLQ